MLGMDCCTNPCRHTGRMWDIPVLTVTVCCKCDNDGGGGEATFHWIFTPLFDLCWFAQGFFPSSGFPVKMGCDYLKHIGQIRTCENCDT